MTVERRAEFAGTPRFEIENRIGSGGMGVVYRAYDRERDATIALKVLRRLNPLAIYRFKREFRSISEITHPNLVSLYELVNAGDEWFFTLELIEGREVLDYVRGVGTPAPWSPSQHSEDGELGTATTQVRRFMPVTTAVEPLSEPAQFRRLHNSLVQLAEGIVALHGVGHLHRDIKPSNVMVTDDGRVVLLDFGIVTALEEDRRDDKRIVGTPAYMAPEQAAGEPLSEASDWYSVGVVMFEAITGRRPPQRLKEVGADAERQAVETALQRLAPATPRELTTLCVDLLAREPSARPPGVEVLARLHGSAQMARTSAVAPVPRRKSALLIGRTQHLRKLDDAFVAVSRGEQRTIYVSGGSGIGKTALVQFFLAGLTGIDRALVLSGRCYERESVPYKAVDSLVDGLTRQLLEMPPREVRQMLPLHAPALAKLFPVLNRVRAFRQLSDDSAAATDRTQLRRRAFDAFRTLLARLCENQPVVMHIDDVQWGDSDSAALLADLVRPPSPPPFMLVMSYRDEGSDTSAFLRTLAAEHHNASELAVQALTDFESRELSLALIERGGGDPSQFDIEGIAREAAGSPFFVGELVRFLLESGSAAGYTWVQRGVKLDEVLRHRIADLPDAARRVLEAVAVAGRPVPQRLALRVAAIGDQGHAALTTLRNRRMVRTRGPREEDAIEPYHDRVQEAVYDSMSEASVRLYHRDLAYALEEAGDVDPEHLAVHFEGAGDFARAARLCEQAAQQAEDTLAFSRAASLYRRALRLQPRAGEAEAGLRAKLGRVLASAGRGAEAADAYLDATANATAADAAEYRLRGVEQLLRSGHIDEGLKMLETVLDSIGMQLPGTPRRALFGLLRWRLRIRLRGTGFERRSASEVPDALRRRLDVCWSAASALAFCDPVRGAYFQARHLLLALDGGEVGHAARALAIEACYAAQRGHRNQARAEELAGRARELASGADDSLALVWAEAAHGLIAFSTERWQATLDALDRVLPILYDRCVGAAYELHASQMFRVFALFYNGELGALARTVPEQMREATSLGDVYAATDLGSGLANIAWLVTDDPAGARAVADEARRSWRPAGFHLQHYWDMVAHSHIRLYQGYGDAAWRDVVERWNGLRRSHLLFIHMVHVEALHLRARCALAAAARGDSKPLGAARRDAQRLERIGTRAAIALAGLVRAGIAAVAGDQEEAERLLRLAIEQCEGAEMWAYETAARRVLGLLVGGDEGSELVRVADDWLASQSVVNAPRMTAMLVPGFGDLE